MPEFEIIALQKILHALLLIQLDQIEESNKFPLLVRAGWANAEIATALGVTENAVAVRRTRSKQKVQKEKE